jgi:hypothetical protein
MGQTLLRLGLNRFNLTGGRKTKKAIPAAAAGGGDR